MHIFDGGAAPTSDLERTTRIGSPATSSANESQLNPSSNEPKKKMNSSYHLPAWYVIGSTSNIQYISILKCSTNETASTTFSAPAISNSLRNLNFFTLAPPRPTPQGRQRGVTADTSQWGTPSYSAKLKFKFIPTAR
jgi:hypothetical protein